MTRHNVMSTRKLYKKALSRWRDGLIDGAKAKTSKYGAIFVPDLNDEYPANPTALAYSYGYHRAFKSEQDYNDAKALPVGVWCLVLAEAKRPRS